MYKRLIVSFFLDILSVNDFIQWESHIVEVIQTILTALISAITLMILSRLIGNREMSQLSVFDYINSITIGSIAAEMATCQFTDML